MDIARERLFFVALGATLVLSVAAVSLTTGLGQQKEEQRQDISARLEGVVNLKEGDETGRASTYSAGGLFAGVRGQTGTAQLGRQPEGYVVLQVGKWREGDLVLVNSAGEEVLATAVDASSSLWVEDLSVSPFKDVQSNITVFTALERQDMVARELILEGDILAVIYPLEEGLTPDNILTLVLRRYGGLAQLQKETPAALSAPR